MDVNRENITIEEMNFDMVIVDFEYHYSLPDGPYADSQLTEEQGGRR